MTTTLTVIGDGNYQLVRKHSSKPFSMTRRFQMKHSKDNVPDLLDVMGLLSKGALDLFLTIKCDLNYKTNMTVLDISKETPSERTRRNKLLRELSKHHLIKRVPLSVDNPSYNSKWYFPKNTYIVNPDYIRPSDKYIEMIETCFRASK
jgi:predicted transcriptional regulator